MKKRIIALLLTVFMLFGASAAYSSSSVASVDFGDEDLFLMQQLLSKMGISSQVSGEYVTRGEFLLAVMSLASFSGDYAEESFYADIKAASPLGFAAYHASRFGVISPSENFYPDSFITLNEAVKLMCALLGYGELAAVRGGYPYGYWAIANELDMFDAISLGGSDYITSSDFLNLLENFVSAPTYQIYSLSYADGSYTSNYASGATVLGCYHDIYHIEGIMTANSVSDLYDEDLPVSASAVTVGNTVIEGTCADYLGMNVRAFYKKNGNKKELLTIAPYRNDVKTLYYYNDAVFCADYVSFVDESGKTKKYLFDDTLAVICDGKADKNHNVAYTHIADGYIELVDSNDNSRYDCIKIWNKKYILVDKVDIVDRVIYDVNIDNIIDMSDLDVLYSLTGIETIDDILTGSCIEYTVSKDGLFYTIELVSDTVSGVVEGYDTTSRTVVIDNIEYYYTDYYAAHYITNTVSGTSVTAVLSSDGRLIANTTQKDTEYLFGYLFAASQAGSGLNNEYKIKLFSEKSELCILTLDDKITFNGTKTSPDLVAAALSGEQIIKYHTNSKGEVVALNTQLSQNGIFDDDTEDKNILKRYWYLPEDSTKSVYYSRNGFVPTYFMVNSSTVLFRVYPTDVQPDEEKRVQVATVSNLIMSNPSVATSSIEAYNVDESGYAGAVVYRASKNSSMYARASWGIVVSANYALDDDGNKVIKLELYNADSFGTMYIAADNPYLESQQSIPFTVGDLIRYESLDSVLIDKWKTDYDAKTHTLNYTSGNYYSSLDYFSGELDAVYSNSISFRMDEKDGSVRRAFYPVSLSKYCYVSLAGDVQTLPYSKLAGLLQNGGKKFRLLLKCSDTTANQLVIYEIQ